jgi:hypothetical protein
VSQGRRGKGTDGMTKVIVRSAEEEEEEKGDIDLWICGI